MFIRVVKQKRGKKLYEHVQIVESFRDPAKGNAPRTRILLHLGTLDKLGKDQLDRLILGLKRAKGEDAEQSSGEPILSSARDFGHVYAVGRAWDRLALSRTLQRAGLAGKSTFPVADMIRLLVVNRLCEPKSKLALLDWLEGVHYSDNFKPSYHHLLRAMDRLGEVKHKAEPLLAKRFLNKDEPLDLVFYDITSTYFEGDRSIAEDDFRRYGYSRDGRFDKRQVVIGMVTTREGIPICHHVFDGNTADKATVAAVVRDLKERFSLKRIVFVGDRGMLSDLNLTTLLDEQLGFIVAHPLRKNSHAREVIGSLWKKFDRSEDAQEQFLEDGRESVRFIVAYSPQIAQETKKNRMDRLRKADAWIDAQLEKLACPAARGRKAAPQGTYNRIRDYLRDKNLLRFYKIEFSGKEISVVKDRKALLWEAKIDGVLMVETTDMDLPAKEIISRYKDLAEIERGWRSLKSTLLVRPVHHWTEGRIRAHIFVCVLALQLERWMRRALKDLAISPPKAIESLQQIKMGEIELNDTKKRLVSRPTNEQREMLSALGVPPIPTSI